MRGRGARSKLVQPESQAHPFYISSKTRTTWASSSSCFRAARSAIASRSSTRRCGAERTDEEASPVLVEPSLTSVVVVVGGAGQQTEAADAKGNDGGGNEEEIAGGSLCKKANQRAR